MQKMWLDGDRTRFAFSVEQRGKWHAIERADAEKMNRLVTWPMIVMQINMLFDERRIWQNYTEITL